jgi:glyoxylase-like metal-dependent hydrolase (beta-lactamase superfamily II)
MTETAAAMPVPAIPDEPPVEVAPSVHVLLDGRINLVPNTGIVVGERAVLVVDTGMGVANGRRVLAEARRLGGGRPLFLTVTHFHPEHGWGAQVLRDEATLLYNETQREELNEKFDGFVELFSTFSPEIAAILAEVELVAPHVTYGDEARLDLGGLVVELRAVGTAHTRGDQTVYLPEHGVLFTGDLVENRFLPILPDADAHGSPWIDVLERLEALAPKVVVPGHGEVGETALIREVRSYLEDVRERVGALGPDVEVETAKQRLEPELRERYADWDNPIWIPFAVESFHRELSGVATSDRPDHDPDAGSRKVVGDT